MRHFLLSLGDAFCAKRLGPFLRNVGLKLDKFGVALGKYEYVEEFVRSTRNVPTDKAVPDLGATNFVAPSATVVGDVQMGHDSSIWYGAVLRGDLHQIAVGDETIIQDGTTIRRKGNASGAVQIGRNVFIGPNCSIGAVTIADNAFVSMGACLEDGVKVESYGVVAAGAVVPAGTTVKSGEIWAGSPAVFLRKVGVDEREAINEHLAELRDLAAIHSEETEKTFDQLFYDELRREQALIGNTVENMERKLDESNFLDDISSRHEAWQVQNEKAKVQNDIKYWSQMVEEPTWKPFTEDGEVYPKEWKMYGEDMARRQKASEMFEKPAPPRMPEPNLRSFPRDQTPWTKRY